MGRKSEARLGVGGTNLCVRALRRACPLLTRQRPARGPLCLRTESRPVPSGPVSGCALARAAPRKPTAKEIPQLLALLSTAARVPHSRFAASGTRTLDFAARAQLPDGTNRQRLKNLLPLWLRVCSVFGLMSTASFPSLLRARSSLTAPAASSATPSGPSSHLPSPPPVVVVAAAAAAVAAVTCCC